MDLRMSRPSARLFRFDISVNRMVLYVHSFLYDIAKSPILPMVRFLSLATIASVSPTSRHSPSI
jgi:hypothetical protein